MCADAWQRAAIREVKRLSVAEEMGAAVEIIDGGVVLCQDDFLAAKRNMVPSVTPEMLEKYEDLRLKFS